MVIHRCCCDMIKTPRAVFIVQSRVWPLGLCWVILYVVHIKRIDILYRVPFKRGSRRRFGRNVFVSHLQWWRIAPVWRNKKKKCAGANQRRQVRKMAALLPMLMVLETTQQADYSTIATIAAISTDDESCASRGFPLYLGRRWLEIEPIQRLYFFFKQQFPPNFPSEKTLKRSGKIEEPVDNKTEAHPPSHWNQVAALLSFEMEEN